MPEDMLSCLLAGVVVGMLLLIVLSKLGFVVVPSADEKEHIINLRKDDAVLAEFRGDSKPPVVRGDPFILAMQNSSRPLDRQIYAD